MHYKVITEKMQSLGLRRNPNIMTFELNKWKDELNPQVGNKDRGGIWCCNKLSSAKAVQKYYKRYGKSRIFECEIGSILYENSYRTKTVRIKLINEVIK